MKTMLYETETNLNDTEVGVSEEAKQAFLRFLDEIKAESANCSVVNHTNHSNHSNW